MRTNNRQHRPTLKHYLPILILILTATSQTLCVVKTKAYRHVAEKDFQKTGPDSLVSQYKLHEKAITNFGQVAHTKTITCESTDNRKIFYTISMTPTGFQDQTNISFCIAGDDVETTNSSSSFISKQAELKRLFNKKHRDIIVNKFKETRKLTFNTKVNNINSTLEYDKVQKTVTLTNVYPDNSTYINKDFFDPNRNLFDQKITLLNNDYNQHIQDNYKKINHSNSDLTLHDNTAYYYRTNEQLRQLRFACQKYNWDKVIFSSPENQSLYLYQGTDSQKANTELTDKLLKIKKPFYMHEHQASLFQGKTTLELTAKSLNYNNDGKITSFHTCIKGE